MFMNFDLLEQFVDYIKAKVVINYEMLDKYKRFLEENVLSSPIKYRTASHHILPKSEAQVMWVSKERYNATSNYAELYHRDHALAHYYLALAVPSKRLCWALKAMLGQGVDKHFFSITEANLMVSATDYARVEEGVSKFISEHLKGRRVLLETREKNRQGRLGKKDSEESRRKKSIARMGKTMPESTKAKHRRENMSDETRKRLSEGHKPMSEEEKEIRRQRMKEIMTSKPKSEDQKLKLAEANRGKRWYNNGIVEVQVDSTDNTIFDGFTPGRLPAYGKKHSGLQNPNSGNLKWTNGKIEVRGKVCPGEGFVKGSLSNYEPPQDLFSYAGLQQDK
jgi:hypothetical protein